jgi:putative component of membrane protein insertase Oxa1/YidC/SpoIIIJ protein YidD
LILDRRCVKLARMCSEPNRERPVWLAAACAALTMAVSWPAAAEEASLPPGLPPAASAPAPHAKAVRRIPGIPMQRFVDRLAVGKDPPGPTSVPTVLYLWWIKTYRGLVSPGGMKSCGMDPSCSRYFLDSTEKHGGCIGCMMSVDRLIRDNPQTQQDPHYPLVNTPSGPRHSDPVENNDFWFADPPKPATEARTPPP